VRELASTGPVLGGLDDRLVAKRGYVEVSVVLDLGRKVASGCASLIELAFRFVEERRERRDGGAVRDDPLPRSRVTARRVTAQPAS
jgi:hypothetical protein